jgi:hypothetical protein
VTVLRPGAIRHRHVHGEFASGLSITWLSNRPAIEALDEDADELLVCDRVVTDVARRFGIGGASAPAISRGVGGGFGTSRVGSSALAGTS